jgi:hypothetical protein
MESEKLAAKRRRRRKKQRTFASFAPLRGYPFLLLMLLAANTSQAGPVEMPHQTIVLPANSSETLFVDIDGDGLSDLLVMDRAEKALLNFHQRANGFSNSPDQVIPLPPRTAWVAICDVDAHPGLELLMSTADGLVYSRQNAGLFESERRTLIEANQVFTNSDFPILTTLSTNEPGTNDLIPVIFAERTVPYHRNRAYEWIPGPPMALAVKHAAWSVSRDEWMLGPNPAHSLVVDQSFLSKPEPAATEWDTDRVDVDRDGREDLVRWQVGGVVSFKTDISIYLRGADGQLPERPTQILHCGGFPIPFGSQQKISPVHDLKGDGTCELVLLEFKPGLASASGLVETVLSHGLDCSLTIRSFHHGVFASSPDASVAVKIILADWGEFGSFPICLQGDFNGDGRPDLLVRRSETQWNIFFSTNDGRWFAPQPAMTFDASARGYYYYVTEDLNGDGLSDIIWHEVEEHRLSIFMSPPRPAKGRNP